MATTMEELKQKAKAYDKVVGKLKQFMAQGVDPLITRADVQDFFPELKESEDERIRKALVRFHKSTIDVDGIKGEDIIAWLEKQGEQKSKNESTDTCDSLIIKSKEFPASEKRDFGYFSESADKIEPKFKVGDWVVYNRNDNSREIIQVYDIRDGRYYFTDNVHFSWSVKECDERAHLWSIEDAKEGDVLVDVYENTGIFQKNDDFDWTSYCSLGCNGGFQNFEVEHESENAHPATKEQRDTLMKAMADAGYEWDAEKKELKKVEPKFKIKLAGREYNVLEIKESAGVTFYGIEDEPNHIDYVLSDDCEIISGYGVKEKGNSYPTKSATFSEQTSAWNEEDEHRVEDTIYFLDTAKKHYASTVELDACIDWLKSLKDKVQPQPQPKQDWSEDMEGK